MQKKLFPILLAFICSTQYSFAQMVELASNSFSNQPAQLIQTKLTVSNEEYKLKAAFIFRFIQLVDNNWLGQDNVIDLCVSGNEKVVKTFNEMGINNIKGKEIKISYNDMDFKNCNVIYFTQLEEEKTKQALSVLQDSNLLTIGETRYFNDDGGIVQFYKYRGRVKFYINAEAAKQNNIIFNAKLLELGNIRE